MIKRAYYFILQGNEGSQFKPMIQRLDLSTEDEEFTTDYIHGGKHIPQLDSYFGQYCKDRVNVIVNNYKRRDIPCVWFNQFDYAQLPESMKAVANKPTLVLISYSTYDFKDTIPQSVKDEMRATVQDCYMSEIDLGHYVDSKMIVAGPLEFCTWCEQDAGKNAIFLHDYLGEFENEVPYWNVDTNTLCVEVDGKILSVNEYKEKFDEVNRE